MSYDDLYDILKLVVAMLWAIFIMVVVMIGIFGCATQQPYSNTMMPYACGRAVSVQDYKDLGCPEFSQKRK